MNSSKDLGYNSGDKSISQFEPVVRLFVSHGIAIYVPKPQTAGADTELDTTEVFKEKCYEK